MKNRLRFITPAMLRGLGIDPANVAPTNPETARLMAGVKLGYAAMLKRDLNRNRRKPSFIGNFNCSRADGSVIVKGCSAAVWEANRRQALADALAYLEMAKELKVGRK